MSDPKEDFEKMSAFWQEGQTAFFKAQNELAQSFGKSLSDAFKASSADMKMPEGVVWQNFANAWKPTWDPDDMLKSQTGFGGFEGISDDLFALLDPTTWMKTAPDQLNQVLQNIVQGPKFADLANPQFDMAEIAQETLDFQKSAADFSGVLYNTWTRVFEKYSKKFSIEDLQSGNVQKALDAWVKIANSELLDMQKKGDFLDAQRGLLRSGVKIKKRQQENAENWAASYQMPTRTELDDLAKTVYELKTELHKTKKEVAKLKAKLKTKSKK